MGRLSPSSRLVLLLGGIAICALTILAYRPVWHGGFIWDDDLYVTHNSLLTAQDGLRRIWLSLDAPSQYFPLTYTVLRIERSLWGLHPTGYHSVNICFHLANALLVWRLLARLNIPGSWLAATIFAIHPVQVESVAWISELKNVLMGFFFLLTLLAWTEYVDLRSRNRSTYYAAAILFYFLALAAKSTACTLPAALLLILWWKKKPIGRRALFELVPFVVLAMSFALIAIWWERYHQGTRVLTPLPPLERLLIASRAIWFYLSKLFWPSDLTFIYPRWQISSSDAVAYVWLVVTAAAVVLTYFVRRTLGRGLEVAALFFVATLSPLIGFIMLYTFRYTFVADHYQYLACIGPIAFTAASFVIAAEKGKHSAWVSTIGVLPIVACLIVLTSRQSATYRDLETLWRSTIAKDPTSWIGYNNLGVVQFEKGDVDDAIAKYERSLRLYPNYPEAHYNLGGALLLKGAVDNAIEHCKRALQLQPNEPDALLILGNAFMAKQDVDEAIRCYSEVVTLRPDDRNGHHNLGIALQEKGEPERAARELDIAKHLEGNGSRN